MLAKLEQSICIHSSCVISSIFGLYHSQSFLQIVIPLALLFSKFHNRDDKFYLKKCYRKRDKINDQLI